MQPFPYVPAAIRTSAVLLATPAASLRLLGAGGGGGGWGGVGGGGGCRSSFLRWLLCESDCEATLSGIFLD